MSVVTPNAITDEALRAAIGKAHLPSLLPALGLITNRWDEVARLHPERYRIVEEQGGMSPESQEAARAYAFDALRTWRDAGMPDATRDIDALLQGLRPLLGKDFGSYRDLSLEELAIHDPDPRAPRWTRSSEPGEDVLDVLVIGAGLSGLLAAHRFRQAGLSVLVLDKNDDIGGTWLENSYPGCRADVPSHLYCYSADAGFHWRDEFATRDEIMDSLRHFVAERDLAGHLRLGHEVTEAAWDQSSLRWTVRAEGPDGPETFEALAVVSAVGQLNRPSIPEIAGQADFAGRQFHSARWDHDAPIDGRRFAVVGTGASAIQIVTGLLEAGASVTVFQRSPTWLYPTAELRRPIDDGNRWLLANVPTYARWYRLWLHRSVSDGLLPFADCDPDWDDPRSVSAANDAVRQALTEYLEEQFGRRPDLLEKMLPTYPPFAKRVVRDDGSWARAFIEQGAQLVAEPIERITERGIQTAGGEAHPVDAIVYATGFQASRFLVPMRIRGRDGRDLHEQWGPDATAYLGMAVPGFPNFFMLYGPNTNIVVNGNVIFYSECQITYLLDCLRRIVEEGVALDCRQEVHDEFVARVDELNARRAWGCAGVRNWYLSPTGRVSQNWPSTALEYWERTRSLDPEDYRVLRHKEARHA